MSAPAPAGGRLATAWREYRLTLIVVAALVMGYLALRTRPSDVGSLDELAASLQAGQVTVIEFYSNR
mgnify:CR=1 FL=1